MNTEIWIVDDDASIRWVLERALQQSGWQVRSFAAADECLAALAQHAPDVVITDIRMKGQDGLALLQQLHRQQLHLPVIMMTAHSDLDTAVAAYESGAFEYLPKPFDVDEVVALVARAAHQNEAAAAFQPARREGAALIGKTAAMQNVFRAIGRLSRASVNVLITGETGDRKSVV